MLEGFPIGANLQAPLKFSQIVGKVVGCCLSIVVGHFDARRVAFPQISLIDVSIEFSFHQVGKEYAEFEVGAGVNFICTENGKRQE